MPEYDQVDVKPGTRWLRAPEVRSTPQAINTADRHSRAGGNPYGRLDWIPVFTGRTHVGECLQPGWLAA
jgi:hypothetical protein